MKKIKKDVVLLLLAFLLVVGVPVGATLAIMHNRTNEVVNTFAPAYVDCTIKEEFDGDMKTSVQIKNTSNVQAFLRIRVLSHWEDSKGNVVDRPTDVDEYAVRKDTDEVEGGLNTDYWLYDEADKTYYCILPIAPGEETPNLLQDDFLLRGDDPVSEEVRVDGVYLYTNTYYHVIEFVAEAIQSQPEEAVEVMWPVSVENNRIVSVS